MLLRGTPHLRSKRGACPDTMDRARDQIGSAHFSVLEYTKKREGLEVVISHAQGVKTILNSLEIFAGK